MEILELKLVQNKEKILNSIETLEQDGKYIHDQSIALELSSKLNEIALVLIGEEKVQESLEFLRKAETFSYQSSKHKAQTYNSIATFYRKQGKILTALKYIERSISLYPHGTAYLNLCAVLSIQGKFEKALEVAMHSIIFVQDEIIEEKIDAAGVGVENAEVLAVAFYNLAVQLEYLKRTDEASSYYRKSVEFSGKYLGDGNCVRDILKQIFDKIIAGTNVVGELKAKSDVIKPQIKKRVIIKGRSKSPINKSPLAAGGKDGSEKKLARSSASHRKFVKVGMTKAKFMENYAVALGKSIESADDGSKSASRSIKVEKNPSEISFKSKIDPEKQKKSENDLSSKPAESKKPKKIKKLKTDEIKSELDPDPEKKSPKSLIVLVPEQKTLIEAEKNSNSLVNSFEEITENEEILQKVFIQNGQNLSPVSRNSIDNAKFGIGTDENFTDFLKIEEDIKFNIEETDKNGESFKGEELTEELKDRMNDKEKMEVVNEDNEDSESEKQDKRVEKNFELSLRFPLKLSKTNKDSLFDSFQVPRRVNNSQCFTAKYL